MLKNFFKPRSIAVIGASADPEKLGNVVFKNLITHRFKGVAYPINLTGEKVYGEKAYKSVADLPTVPDLVVVVIPAAYVPDIIRQCGKKKIRAAIIISAGFAEQGVEGQKREQSLKRLADQCGVRLMGPNCLGILLPSLRMNASFADGLPASGSVTVISQSGAMAVAITDWAITSGLGFSALVSLGNKADITEEEVIKYFSKDRQTSVIIMYLENLATGRSLLRAIKQTTKKKPVIILLPGKSEQAKQAIVSHTGVLAGSHAVYAASLRAAGAIVVDTLEQLFVCARLFTRVYSRLGSRVAIVTNAGGPGILATDAVMASSQLNLAKLTEATQQRLKKLLPPAASIHNPIDVVGDAPPKRYDQAVGAVIADKRVDAMIGILTNQYVTDTDKVAESLIRWQRRYPRKPIIVSFIGGSGVAAGRVILSRHGIVHFPYPEQAVWALSVLQQHVCHKKTARTFSEAPIFLAGRPTTVIGKRAEGMIKKYVPEILPSALARTSDQAAAKAKKIGYPLVAKIISNKIIHKTDRGAVRVNISTEHVLRAVLEKWEKIFSLQFGADEGFLLQPYRPGQIELIIGAKRDPIIGPYLLVGLGGIFVEAFSDPAIAPAPVTISQARTMLTEGAIGKIIFSPRGMLLPQTRLARMIVSLGRFMMEKPWVSECDLNPVIISDGGLSVADIRLVTYKR